MSITINPKAARLTFKQWLHFNRIDRGECSGECEEPECCKSAHKQKLEKEYRTEKYNDDVRLGLVKEGG